MARRRSSFEATGTSQRPRELWALFGKPRKTFSG